MNSRARITRGGGLRPLRTYVGVVVALLGLAGCVGAPADASGLNSTPESLDEAEETLALIDAMLDADPEDAQALSALQALRPRLDELNHLVARVELGPDHDVSFYEIEPGVVGVSESAPEGVERVLAHGDVLGVPITEIYARLALEPAPESLVAAQAREEARVEGEASLSVDSAAEAIATEGERLTEPSPGVAAAELTGAHGSYFRDTYCFTGGEFRGCYPNWGGGGYAQASAKTSFFTVAPYSGNVSVRFQYDGSTRFTDPVFQGEVRSWWWHSASYDPAWPPFSPRDYYRRTHRWDILHASGDAFHWTFTFRWDCSYSACNTWLR